MGVGRGDLARLGGRSGDEALLLGAGVGRRGGLGAGLGLGGALLGVADAVLGLLAQAGGLLVQAALVIGADLGLDRGTQGVLVDVGGLRVGDRGDGGGGRAGAGVLQVALQVLDAQTEIRVLVLELAERILDEVEELVDLVLVVAALANRRLAERDVVHISWSQRHGEFPFKICGRCIFTGRTRRCSAGNPHVGIGLPPFIRAEETNPRMTILVSSRTILPTSHLQHTSSAPRKPQETPESGR